MTPIWRTTFRHAVFAIGLSHDGHRNFAFSGSGSSPRYFPRQPPLICRITFGFLLGPLVPIPHRFLGVWASFIERILIDKPGSSVIVRIKAVPASMIQEGHELARELGATNSVTAQ